MNNTWPKSLTATTPDGRFPVTVKKMGDGFQASCLYFKPGRMFGVASSPPKPKIGLSESFNDDTEAEAFEKLADWLRGKWGTDAAILNEPFS